MARLDRVPTAPHSPGRDAIAALRAGKAFAYVLADDAGQRAATLDSVIMAAADPNTRFVRVGNPLRAPLTLERLVIQVAGPEADLRHELAATDLASLLASAAGDDARLVIVIEQPETIDPAALSLLRQVAPGLAASTPSVQLLFCGTTAFQPILAAEPRAALEPMAEVASRRSRAPLVLVGLAVLMAATGVAVWRHPELRERAAAAITAARPGARATGPVTPAEAAPAAQPAAVAQPVPASLPPAASPSAPASAPDAAQLRREFDQFLAQRPDAARLTETEKAALLQEFLDWRRAKSAATSP